MNMAFICAVIVVLGAHVVAGQGDAWLVNITSSIYGLPWNQAEAFTNKNSSRFKEEQNFFCGKINDIFQSEPVIGNPVKERYYSCFIDNFQQSNSHTEAPVSFTYSLVFNGTSPVPKPIVDGLLAGNTETYHFGNKVWTLIGEWLISRTDVQTVSVNLSDYLVAGKENKKKPKGEVNTVVDLTADLLNFTMTPEISNPSSAEFSALSGSFCKEVSRYLLGRFPSYKECSVTAVVNNSVEGRVIMKHRLTFGLDRDVIYPHMVAGVIVEVAPRLVVGNHTVLHIGPVTISESSLLNTPTGTAPDTRDRPDANPCLPDKSKVILPDPADPSAYIICIRNTYFRFSCGKNQTFDSSINKCVKRV